MNHDKLIKELYKKHKTFDPFELSEKLNIEIFYVPFNRRPLGKSIKDEVFDTPLILLDSSLKNTKEAFFVCAHELCHSICHDELYSYYIANYVSYAKLEVEANNFAITLAAYDYELNNGKKPEFFSQLKNQYGIPSEFIDLYF